MAINWIEVINHSQREALSPCSSSACIYENNHKYTSYPSPSRPIVIYRYYFDGNYILMGSDFQQPRQYLPGRYLHLIASLNLQMLVLHNKCTTKLESPKQFKTYSICIYYMHFGSRNWIFVKFCSKIS